ncbi:hypothetical protein [Sphingobacterium mizutaii]|uniref:hypothetical protein n=1 Tax=Sphingobacterium mizutaii TaxID=1010 RepID=UPI002897A92B|nr:hypothetical protein [Sphingobacterium mizutaii]
MALVSFGQRKATASMVLEMSERVAYGEDVDALYFRLKQIRQLNKLFDFEIGNPYTAPDEAILLDVLNEVNFLLGDYVWEGDKVLYEDIILPLPAQKVIIRVVGDGSGIELPPVEPGNYVTTLSLSKGAFTPDYTYVNYGLKDVAFTLTISGGIQLRPGVDYVISPAGGFQLINGVAMASSDIITLTAVTPFGSVPSVPESPGNGMRYVQDDYVEDNYVE